MSIEKRLERMELLLLIQMKDILTTSEASTLLGITPAHLTRLSRERKIPYYREGKKYFYNKKELQEFFLSNHYPIVER